MVVLARDGSVLFFLYICDKKKVKVPKIRILLNKEMCQNVTCGIWVVYENKTK